MCYLALLSFRTKGWEREKEREKRWGEREGRREKGKKGGMTEQRNKGMKEGKEYAVIKDACLFPTTLTVCSPNESKLSLIPISLPQGSVLYCHLQKGQFW